MMMNFADRLISAIDQKKNPSIIGLDTELAKIPHILQDKYRDASDPFKAASDCMLEFNLKILDAIKDTVPAVKVQIAFYEQYGYHGIRAFHETVKAAKARGLVVITDGKRNDIGNTARAYADAHIGTVSVFGKTLPGFDADGITVNAYLGTDGVQPFVDNIKKFGKGIFVLVKTSNPSSGELQDVSCGSAKVYEVMARLVDRWGQGTAGTKGYQSVGAVVGATYPKEADSIRRLIPKSIILVPGYGAQGGGALDAMPCFNADGYGAIIHSARAVIYAGSGPDFAEKAHAASVKMKEDITTALQNKGIYPW
jgi:orotidine-5'-phosphate decarboxylase